MREHEANQFKVKHPVNGFPFPSGAGKRSSKGAFTFVEILASMLFLAILVPAILQALTLANKASEVSERNAVAAELASNKLSDLTLNQNWTTAETKGDFGADWPGYRYEVNQAQWDQGGMNQLCVNVFYNVQGKERSVQLATLVSQSGTISQ